LSLSVLMELSDASTPGFLLTPLIILKSKPP
jgi:hypothetical protein